MAGTDRIAEYQPVARAALRMAWHDLLFAHWRWDANDIAARLPPDLVPHTFAEHAWLGVVPFRMCAVAPAGIRLPAARASFLECNLRTYVRTRDGRTGVWFFTLDCNDALAVLAARAGFALPYRFARMTCSPPDPAAPVSYTTTRPAGTCRFVYQRSGAWRSAGDDPFEQFLAERYRLFAWRSSLGQLLTAQVDHAPYHLADADVTIDAAAIFRGNGFVPPTCPPDHVAVADRVAVRGGLPRVA